MTRVFFWYALLIVRLGAIPIPENKWRGNGLNWRDEYNSKGLLGTLSQRGFQTLVQSGGSLGWVKSSGVYSNPIRAGLSEREWEHRYPYRNLLELQFEDNLVTQISKGNPEVSDDLVRSLQKHLDRYERKVDSLVIRLSCSAKPNPSLMNHWSDRIEELGYGVGLSLCSTGFMSLEPFYRSPEFVILRLNHAEWNESALLQSFATRLSTWNRPFFFGISMQPSLEDSHGFPVEKSIAEKLLQRELLNIVDEGINSGSRWARMVLNEPSALGDLHWQKGAVFTLKEPGNEALSTYLKLIASTESYWFSGSILNMDSWSPRILLKETKTPDPPRVYYKITPGKKGVSLELSLENPTPIPSNGTESGAGIVLEYSGYHLKGIEFGDFRNLKTHSSRGRNQILLSLSSLPSYASAKGLRVDFQQKGEGGHLKVLGWIQPRAGKSIHYDRGAKTSLLPEFAVSELGQSVWTQGAEGTR